MKNAKDRKSSTAKQGGFHPLLGFFVEKKGIAGNIREGTGE